MNRFCVLAVLFASMSAVGATKVGISFDDEINLAKQKLVLNGLGIREATFLNVDVYVAGLYTEAKSKDPATLINQKGNKRIHLKFVRDVDGEDIGDAWNDSLEKNCKKNCESLKPKVQQLVKMMENMKDKDEMIFDFVGDKTLVSLKGKPKGEIVGNRFRRLMLITWLGPEPPNSSLKEGMLGISDD